MALTNKSTKQTRLIKQIQPKEITMTKKEIQNIKAVSPRTTGLHKFIETVNKIISPT
jgi:hypothetical protein